MGKHCVVFRLGVAFIGHYGQALCQCVVFRLALVLKSKVIVCKHCVVLDLVLQS